MPWNNKSSNNYIECATNVKAAVYNPDHVWVCVLNRRNGARGI